MTTFVEVKQYAQALNLEERAQLVGVLLESLYSSLPEVQVAWSREIAERINAFEGGKLQAFTAEAVFAEARNLLN